MNKFEPGDVVVLKAKQVGHQYSGIILRESMVFEGPKVIEDIDSTTKNYIIDYFRYSETMLKFYTIKDKKK